MAPKVKNLPAFRRLGSIAEDWDDALEKGRGTHSSEFLPGESHGQRSLVGFNHSVAESDKTEMTQHTCTPFIGNCNRLTNPQLSGCPL